MWKRVGEEVRAMPRKNLTFEDVAGFKDGRRGHKPRNVGEVKEVILL